MSKKILFVAMQMSIHTTRWINQLSDAGWSIHIFPVNHAPVHPKLKGVTVHQPFTLLHPKRTLYAFIKRCLTFLTGRQFASAPINPNQEKAIFPLCMIARYMPYIGGLRVRLGESDATVSAIYGPRVLARLIKKLKPDLIHSLEFQHCGYNVLKAKEKFKTDFPLWFATNWGSDIYYYQQFDDHKRQISRLLSQIDYYSCECHRDEALARALGYKGSALATMPNTGGFDLETIQEYRQKVRTSKRSVIMIKGYQHFAGRALTALEAIVLCQKELEPYNIVIFSPTVETVARVQELKLITRLTIHILPHTSHEKLLYLMSNARIYLGVSISDAISTSMLEAMALGAFPIQTDTSCCNEWIEDGKSGFSIPADDIHYIAEKLKQAVADDHLVDNAAELNWITASERLDEKKLKEQAKAMYQTIFAA